MRLGREPTAANLSTGSGGTATWPLARAIARDAAQDGPPACRLPLEQTCGLRLAEDVRATQDMPATDRSAMDGWAVSGPPPWRWAGDVSAADPRLVSLSPGSAVRVATGSIVPTGTDSVVRAEDAMAAVDGTVCLRDGLGSGQVGAHIRHCGEEARTGELLVPAGSAITPPVLGLAAAAGRDDLLAFRRARVHSLVMGDELITHGSPGRGRVRDALGPQLPSWIRALGGEEAGATRLSDGPDDLPNALHAILCERDSAAVDVVITTGGTAHGPADHVRRTVADLGGHWLIERVAVRPGHPMCLARFDDGLFMVSLPGNPLAACAALLTLVEPLVTALAHAEPREALPVAAAGDHPSSLGQHQLIPSTVRSGVAEALPQRGSAMLRGLAHADGMLIIPPEGLRAGAAAELLPLPWAAESTWRR